MMNTLKKMAVSAVAALAGVMMVAPTAMANSGTIPINAAHFPDTGFRVLIARDCDSYPKDGKLTLAERNAVTNIGVNYDDIKSAKGIEYFPNLERLNLSDQHLTSIDLSHNTKLKQLYLNWNQLTKIDLSKNTALWDLDLSSNKLTSINVSRNTKLTEFDFSGNPLLWISPIAPAVTIYSDYTNDYKVNGGIVNLKSAAPGIDLSRISNVRGGKIENGIAMPDRLNGTVTYRYTYDYTHEPLEAQIDFTPSVWFTDVNVYSTPHAMDIQWMGDNKITTGWLVNGRFVFRGMDNVKRQDMAAFLKRLAAKANKGQNIRGKAFADVNRSTPHWQEIQWLGGSGISTGWPSNRGPVFRGMDTVKRQDMAAFIHRLNNLLG